MFVGHSEALDPQDTQAAPGEVEQGCTAETADPDDDHVKGLGAIHDRRS
jgi:hypothetical protein